MVGRDIKRHRVAAEMLRPPVLGKVLVMLFDSYGRTFRYLRLSVTDICNYRCNYCLPDGMPCDTGHKLSVKNIKMLANAAARLGIQKVRITGGEPSVRKDLTQIISVLKSTPGIETVALTTNGHQLKKHLSGWLEAGLDQLNISCDSLDARVFQAITGRDQLDNLLEAIELAQNSALKSVKVNTVLLRDYNLANLNEFIDWASGSNITLRFIELMETGDNDQYFSQNHVSADTVQQQLLNQGWQQMVAHKNAGPAKEYFHPDHVGKIGFIAPYSDDFCDSCNRLRISSSAKFHLCLFGESGFDLMPWLENDDLEGLLIAMQDIMETKPRKHYLQQNNTGSTANLAMLGG